MTETLVIRLRASEEAPASWLIVDGNGARSGPVQSGPVADALALAQGRRTVIILPATEATLAAPELPVRGGARIAQAVPFALEEQLASDLEYDAFRRRHAQRDDRRQRHAGGHGRRARYSTAGRPPGKPPASTPTRPIPNLRWFLPRRMPRVLVLDEATLHVKRPDAVAYALDARATRTSRSIWRSTTPLNPVDHVTFYATPADYETHKAMIEGLRARTATLQVKLLPDGTLPLLAAQIPVAHPVNVLQGAYAAPSSFGTQLKRWRLPAGLAAATLLAFLAAQGVEALAVAQGREAARRPDHARSSTSCCRVSRSSIRARSSRACCARAGGGQGALLPAISLLAQAMARAPAARIEGMIYRAGVLELRVIAPNVEALDSIKQAMSQNGATVELQSANPRDKSVEGRLQVKLGAA